MPMPSGSLLPSSSLLPGVSQVDLPGVPVLEASGSIKTTN